MHKIIKQAMALFVIVSLALIPFGSIALAQESNQGQAQFEEMSAEAMIADFLVVRPLGIVATAVGAIFFVVSLPFSALGGNTKDAARKLIVAPAKHTFARPLGDFPG